MNRNHFLFIFKVFGLNSIPEDRTNCNNFRKVLTVFYISWCIFLLLLQHVVQEQLYYITDNLGMITDMIQTILPLVSHLIILISAVVKRNLHQKLHQKLSEIFRSIDAKCMYKNNPLAMKSCTKCLTIFIGFCFFNQIMIMSLPKHRLWNYSLLVKTSSEFIMRLNDFHCLFYVLQLNHVFKTMNRILEKAAHPREFSKSHVNNMIFLKRLTNNTWEAADYINQRFGFSLVWTVVTNFVLILSSAYWISFKAVNRAYKTIPLTLTSILLIFSPIVSLIALFFVSAKCMQNVIINEVSCQPLIILFLVSTNGSLFTQHQPGKA